MLVLDRRFGLLRYRRAWFADQPVGSALSLTSLRQYAGPVLGFPWRRREFHTLVVDLSRTPDELLSAMKKNTAYEIRRAEKDGVETGAEPDPAAFIAFFNDFAPTRDLPPLRADNLASMASALEITKATHAGDALAMHAYLVDPESSRARLLYSATAVRDAAGTDRALVGRANRYLHWTDMLAFKARGVLRYDLGGIAGHPDDPATAGIDAFKLGFGGVHLREDHYDSFALAFAMGVKDALKAVLRFVRGRRLRTGRA